MATSKTDIVVCGLTLTVYGLEEYKQLPKNTPAAVLFAIHGRLQEKGRMQPIAESLCQLNTSRAADQRHLIVVAYDQLNHGTRLVEKRANFSWKEGKHQNASHAMDMWRMIRSGANTISELIDVLEHYLFDTRPVQLWGCLGFSLGGHIAFLAGANDPRLSVVIPIVGTSDFVGLMNARLQGGDYPEGYFPAWLQLVVGAHYQGIGEKLAHKKLLAISGAVDQLVPGKFNDPLVEHLRRSPAGKESKDWARVTVAQVGHAWCPEMHDLAKAWCHQWLVSASPAADFALALPDTCKL